MTEPSAGARKALFAAIAVLLGAGVVSAVAQSSDGDAGTGSDTVAMETTSTAGDTAAVPAPDVTTAPAAGTPGVTAVPGATTAPGAGTAGAGSPATTAPAASGGGGSAGSGLTAEGTGEVAGGDPVIAETGGESLLGLGFVLVVASAVARRLSRS